MKSPRRTQASATSGFTLTELLMAVSVLSLVLAGVICVYIASLRVWHSTTLRMDASYEASTVLQKMVYGIGEQSGLRAASASRVTVETAGTGWRVVFTPPNAATNTFIYDADAERISYLSTSDPGQEVAVAEHVVSASAFRDAEGLRLAVVVGMQRGRYAATNQVSTYVRFRN